MMFMAVELDFWTICLTKRYWIYSGFFFPVTLPISENITLGRTFFYSNLCCYFVLKQARAKVNIVYVVSFSKVCPILYWLYSLIHRDMKECIV